MVALDNEGNKIGRSGNYIGWALGIGMVVILLTVVAVVWLFR
jgi:hypothetical protein